MNVPPPLIVHSTAVLLLSCAFLMPCAFAVCSGPSPTHISPPFACSSIILHSFVHPFLFDDIIFSNCSKCAVAGGNAGRPWCWTTCLELRQQQQLQAMTQVSRAMRWKSSPFVIKRAATPVHSANRFQETEFCTAKRFNILKETSRAYRHRFLFFLFFVSLLFFVGRD